jgi:hypothetical protein
MYSNISAYKIVTRAQQQLITRGQKAQGTRTLKNYGLTTKIVCAPLPFSSHNLFIESFLETGAVPKELF